MDDHGEMRVDAQNWAAAAIETKKDEKEISRAVKVGRTKSTHTITIKSCSSKDSSQSKWLLILGNTMTDGIYQHFHPERSAFSFLA